MPKITSTTQGNIANIRLLFFLCIPTANIRYPKRYNVNNIKDEEWCEKDFPRAHDFADGIFSIGCPCAVNVTYGFELNLQHESGRNFFKFLTCRKINFRKLKGIIYDFSCGLQRYCMNREPLDFENIQFLVDGVHFAGQKKLKQVREYWGDALLTV